MSSQNNPILGNKPDEPSFANGMLALLGLHSQKTDGMIPAKVLEYDRAKNLVKVQPMVMLVDTENNSRMRNPIGGLPLFSFGGGGFHINFPIKPGDLGWIVAADRDISLFLQTLDAAKPTTMRRKTFGDAWFVPDVFWKYTIAGEDTDALVIQSVDSTTRISISNGVVNITAPTSVKVDTPTATFTGDVIVQKTLTVNSNTMLKANLTVSGLTAVNGGFVATGGGGGQACTLPTTTTIGGIGVYGHGHLEQNPSGQRTQGGMVA